jgi:hypothetical protein
VESRPPLVLSGLVGELASALTRSFEPLPAPRKAKAPKSQAATRKPAAA